MTSSNLTGDFGGQTAADTECANLAAAAHLPSGTYKAWLSTSTLNAVAKMGTARGFIRTDGQPFADQVSDITAGKILNLLNLDENGSPLSTTVWTGTTNAGTTSSFTCTDWTSTSGGGEVGLSSRGPGGWSDDEAAGCGNPESLYCFDTSHSSALTVTPVAGRVAFIQLSAHGRSLPTNQLRLT